MFYLHHQSSIFTLLHNQDLIKYQILMTAFGKCWHKYGPFPTIESRVQLRVRVHQNALTGEGSKFVSASFSINLFFKNVPKMLVRIWNIYSCHNKFISEPEKDLLNKILFNVFIDFRFSMRFCPSPHCPQTTDAVHFHITNLLGNFSFIQPAFACKMNFLSTSKSLIRFLKQPTTIVGHPRALSASVGNVAKIWTRILNVILQVIKLHFHIHHMNRIAGLLSSRLVQTCVHTPQN